MSAKNSDLKPVTKKPVSRDALIATGERVQNATDLGQCMRKRRKKLGYTQVEVAMMLGCSPRLIGEMERGRGSVAFDRMLAYATGLGIDIVAFPRG